MQIRFYSIFACLALSLNVLPAIAATAIPECLGPGCSRTAEGIPWPQPVMTPGFELQILQYRIKLPSPPKKITQGWDKSLVLIRSNTSAMTVEAIQNFPDSQLLGEDFSLAVGKGFSVADSGELMFTKTIEDPLPPTSAADIAIWRLALFMKSNIFGENNPVWKIQKGNLKIYYGEDPFLKKNYQGYLFDTTHPESYIRVYAKGESLKDFENILGSIDLDKSE